MTEQPMKKAPQDPSTNPKDALGKMKPDLSLIPPAAKIHEALAMMNGRDKYGPYNWRGKTVSAMVYLAAAMRHLESLVDGEDFASDSGVHHAGHARACLGIFLDASEQGTLIDDRPVKGTASGLLEKYTKNSDLKNQVAQVIDLINKRRQDAFRDKGTSSISGFSIPRLGISSVPIRRRVYVAGPMRGYAKYNFPAFDAARDLARTKGFDPISPADLDRQHGIHEDTPTTDDGETVRSFVRRDMDALLSLKSEHEDAIALLPGWHKSKGAVSEFWTARWLGLKVLDANTMEPFRSSDRMLPCEYNGQDMLSTARRYSEGS